MTWQQGAVAPRTSPATIAAAILLPPLAVFMMRGLTPAFWLTAAATLAGWLPGVVLALLLVLVPERLPIR